MILDLFKFNTSSSASTYLQDGEIIIGADSKMWVERYRNPGEFSIKGKLSSGLRELLPLGSLISHTNTMEVMIVENHYLSENQKGDSVIEITGRSLETCLEQRVVGMNQDWTTPLDYIQEYSLNTNYTWLQAVWLINEHISSSLPTTFDADDILEGIVAAHNVTGTGESTDRVLRKTDVHSALLDILGIDDLGIRAIRRNTFGHPLGSASNTTLLIHKGVDKTNTVIFSWIQGDIDEAEYLWSNKNQKNVALVTSTYMETPAYLDDVNPPEGLDRRMIVVDASDLDGYLDTAPTGGGITIIKALMVTRGKQVLKSLNQVNITRADISKSSKYNYRVDYDIGDLVTVQGNRNETAVMRVIEFVEIEDETGESGQPTLELYYA